MTNSEDLVAQRWNREYLLGKYEGEAPVPFVAEILATLKSSDLLASNGLYVGCGNGRNYIPLIDTGLNLVGLDISREALKQVEVKRPANANPLVCKNFVEYGTPQTFDYIVSLQVFQHGRQEEVRKHFAHAASLLKPGGVFFLRVNSTATQILYSHRVIERSLQGGQTIEYTDGPKTGLSVHFYSREELEYLTGHAFEATPSLAEVVMDRKPPQTGHWVQWEAIWRKNI